MTDNPSSFRSRLFSAAFWTLLLRIVTRVLGFAATLVVARLLPQADIGALAAILIFDVGLQSMTQVGFAAALVQMPGDPGPYIDTAWTAGVIRAIGVYAIEFIVAPYWCAFFHVPEATTAMRVLGLAQLVMGFHSMATPLLMRELRFDRLIIIYFAETFTFAVITIVLAFQLRTLWAQVIGYVSGFVVRVIVSYWITPVRARLRFDRQKAAEMFQYTKWLTAYLSADFALETADNAVVGRVLGKEPLAQYRMAYQLAAEGPTTLKSVIERVAFPMFSRLQQDRTRVHAHFRATLGLTAATMVPISAALLVLAPTFVPLLLGQRWQPAALPLQILVVATLLRSIIDTGPPLLQGLGYTRADFKLKVIQAGAMCLLLYPAAKYWGTAGIAYAVIAGAVIALPFWVLILREAAGLTFRDFTVPLASPLVAGAVGLATLLLLPKAPTTWPSLFLHGGIFLVAYGSVSTVLYRLIPTSGLAATVAETGR
jgi:O-antigen/teichoic acid export membrane protein